MDKEMHYRMAFMQGGVQTQDAEKYIEILQEETLNRISGLSFDRRLIKPIMEVALKETEQNPGMEFDDAVNGIIKNKVRMLTFMQKFCMR